jgi:hypothetical protein
MRTHSTTETDPIDVDEVGPVEKQEGPLQGTMEGNDEGNQKQRKGTHRWVRR